MTPVLVTSAWIAPNIANKATSTAMKIALILFLSDNLMIYRMLVAFFYVEYFNRRFVNSILFLSYNFEFEV